jgi:hypothetical protein
MVRLENEGSPTTLAHDSARAQRMADFFEDHVTDPLMQGGMVILAVTVELARKRGLSDLAARRQRLSGWLQSISDLPSFEELFVKALVTLLLNDLGRPTRRCWPSYSGRRRRLPPPLRPPRRLRRATARGVGADVDEVWVVTTGGRESRSGTTKATASARRTDRHSRERSHIALGRFGAGEVMRLN